MRRAVLILGSILLTGCSSSDDVAGDPHRDDIQQIASTYSQLKSMTPEPVYVDPVLSMLCRGLEPEDINAARKASGPHALTAVRIYMSNSAAEVFGRSEARYPVGSIIVKEKDAWGEKGTSHDGVGGMIKRPAGYDPEHGDWEYFYFESTEKIERGRIASCVQCHTGASGKDYVFGHWASSAKRQQ
jgi:hypothetical protein